MGSAPQTSQVFTEHQHRELKRGIDHIHDVACRIEGWVTPDLAIRVRDRLRWLDRELEPHVAWEESWLYPEIDAHTGSRWATRAARFDHQQIREAVARVRADEDALLGGASAELLPDLRCHLLGLETLLRAHIEREERYLMPLLEDDAWVDGLQERTR
jgi:iron-sulfur cluster repair protein YtfE (RIC family)